MDGREVGDEVAREARDEARDEAALFDPGILERHTFGDAALAREVLGLFAAQCAALVPGLAGADGPAAARREAAHTLRGAALAVGALRLAARAAALETALEAALADGSGEGRAGEGGAVARTAAATLAALAAA